MNLSHYPTGKSPELPPISSFSSAINFLRNYNMLLFPEPPLPNTKPTNHCKFVRNWLKPSKIDENCITNQPKPPNQPPTFFSVSNILSDTRYPIRDGANAHRLGQCDSTNKSIGYPGFDNLTSRRHRNEKKPIPDEKKDHKYFERRKRNNLAAKKSRDARKIREDQIALRAAILEHENALLRTQMISLKEEMTSLRQMLLISKIPVDQTLALRKNNLIISNCCRSSP